MQYIKKIKPTTLFFFFSIAGTVLFFLLCFRKGPVLLEWLAMENNSKWVMSDHFRHVMYSQYKENVYRSGNEAYFPPLAYIFYYFVFRITTNTPTDIPLEEVPHLPYQMMIFIIYTVVSVVLFVRAVDSLSVSKFKKNLLILAIVFSTPAFAGGIERGNMTFCAVSLLLIAFNWKDSDVAWKREGALLLIAFAAGIKVYPAVFGLIYLREKRWKESVRLIIYGILFFFVPFVFFGGFSSILDYLTLLTEIMGQEYYGRVQFLKGLLSFWDITGTPANIANFAFMLALVLGILFSRKQIRQMCYLAAFMAMVPGNAYRYTLLYFLLSVFVLFREDNSYDWTADDYINAVLLGLLFSIPTVFGILTNFEMNYGIFTYSYVERYIYTIAWFFVFYQFAADLCDCILGVVNKRNRRWIG